MQVEKILKGLNFLPVKSTNNLHMGQHQNKWIIAFFSCISKDKCTHICPMPLQNISESSSRNYINLLAAKSVGILSYLCKRVSILM